MFVVDEWCVYAEAVAGRLFLSAVVGRFACLEGRRRCFVLYVLDSASLGCPGVTVLIYLLFLFLTLRGHGVRSVLVLFTRCLDAV